MKTKKQIRKLLKKAEEMDEIYRRNHQREQVESPYKTHQSKLSDIEWGKQLALRDVLEE